MKDWRKKLIEKIGVPDLTDRLLNQLTGTELNTVLLQLFQKITERKIAADLNQSFQTSRFFKPSPVDPILYKMLETDLLRLVKTYGYHPIELSPLAPLGTCSVLGPVDQFNVVSALRNSEVVSDATNIMALIMAENIIKGQSYPLKYVCTHRHTRSQALSSPAHYAHFGVLCLATGGKDQGNFDFEIKEFIEHIKINHHILQSHFPGRSFIAKIFIRSCELHYSKKLKEALIHTLPGFMIEWMEPANENLYYPVIQFKLLINIEDQWLDMADGGLVDWTQKLLHNKKNRMMISGLGLERLYNLKFQDPHAP